MRSMRMPRPKSLIGLMLIGFTIVAAPLLSAIVNGAVQMNRLSVHSQELVVHGMQGTGNNQRMFEQLNALERQARLYQIIGSREMLEGYTRSNARLIATIHELRTLPLDSQAQAATNVLEMAVKQLAVKLASAEPNSDQMADVINSFPQLADQAAKVSNRIGAQIDRELTHLQGEAQRAQQNLLWQTLLLVPLTLAVVGVFTYVFGRPIRAIDRAISELGRGTFSRPIEIRGPADLEHLASQLEWLRGRLLDLAQEKNRFLRHMSHELKTPLANIREGTELLMDGAVGELQSGQREVTAILRENGMKLQRLIENLLSFSAWQAKSVGLDISEFKLRPLG